MTTDAGTTIPVPVLLITGAVGAGKSTVGAEVFRLLQEAGLASAFIDLAALGNGWPPPPDDPWNERLVHANLACTWANFQRAGARRLVVCRVLEARSLLRYVEAAIPGAQITVVLLRARLELLHAGSGPEKPGTRSGSSTSPPTWPAGWKRRPRKTTPWTTRTARSPRWPPRCSRSPGG